MPGTVLVRGVTAASKAEQVGLCSQLCLILMRKIDINKEPNDKSMR